MTMTMEDHVMKMVELEGHLSIFPDREHLWNRVKDTGLLKKISTQLSLKFDSLTKGVKSRDGLKLQISWREFVVKLGRGLSAFEKFCDQIERFAFHRDCIMQSIGKHCFSYLQNTKAVSTIESIPRQRSTKRSGKQDLAGIRILAGGCLGQMFRLCKKNRGKYTVQMKILSHLLVLDKSKGCPADLSPAVPTTAQLSSKLPKYARLMYALAPCFCMFPYIFCTQ